MVQGETESEEGEEKNERLDEEFQLLLQRTGPRLALRRSYTKRVRVGGPIGGCGSSYLWERPREVNWSRCPLLRPPGPEVGRASSPA